MTDPARRSLADDPGFLAGLANLDRGVSVEDRPESKPPAAEVPAPSPAAAEGRDYEAFFGFHEPPFALTADPRFFYQSNAHDRAVQDLLTAIRARTGIALLTGEAGAGKTTVCRMVTEELDQRTLTSIVEGPFPSFEALIRSVLLDVGVLSRFDAAGTRSDASPAELWNTLRAFLLNLAPLQAFAVIVIDEAHHLSADLLDKVCMLASAGGEDRLLQVVLVGEPQLDARLARRAFADLSSRITARCVVRALEPGEVGAYVGHRMAVAGASPRVKFTDDAVQRIYQFTDGVPRAVNIICDRALTLAHAGSARDLDGAVVLNAARELRLDRPRTPMTTATKLAAAVLLLILAGLGAAAAVFFLPR